MSDNFMKRRKSREPATFLRNRFFGRRANPVREPLKKGSGGINSCFRPSAGTSKTDLAEYHKENMGLRRAHQLARKPNVRQPTSHSIAQGNRHVRNIRTSEPAPHEHRREIERRQRQFETSNA